MLAGMAMMMAVIMVLSILEHVLPPLPFLPPNVRLGLSNIVTMYTLFSLGRRYALLLAVLKSGFVLLMRGVTAGLLSISGGLLSVAVIILLTLIFRNKVSYLILSVAGAVTHNFGQIIMASAILETDLFSVFWPILLIAGTLIGVLTGTLLRVAMPVMDRVFKGKDSVKR